MFDAHANFARSLVVTAPSPSLSGTSLVVTTGTGALFPATPFNCTVSPAGVLPVSTNAEIVRVTAVVGDTLTIVRAQEGTTAKAIAVGYQIFNSVSAKVFTDMEGAMLQFIEAGGVSCTAPGVVFSNSNGVSFGAAGSVITASVNTGTGGGGGAAISAGANSQNTGTVVFSNSNGVTFGLAAGILTASHNGITSQTVQTQGMVSINGSTGAIVFSNSNNVTFGGAGSVITASVTVASTAQSTQPVAASASNGSFLFSTLGFSNANNVTFGTSAGGIITASVNTAAAGNSVNFSAGTTSNNLASIVFSDSNGVSFGLNGSTLTANHNGLTSQSNQAFSASGGSSAFQTLNFANSNGFTFSNNAGSVIASYTVPTQSTQPVAASASNGSFAFSTLGFSNANGVTFGTSAGSIVTASVNTAAGAGAILSFWDPVPWNNSNTSFYTAVQNVMYFDPMPLPCAISFNRMNQYASFNFTGYSSSTTATGQQAWTHQFAIYSRSQTNSTAADFSNSNTLVSMFSAANTQSCFWSATGSSISMSFGWQTNETGGSSSQTISTNASGMTNNSFQGQKILFINGATSLPAGEYWVANRRSSSSAGNASASSLFSIAPMIIQMMTNGSFATGMGAVSNTTVPIIPGLGAYSVVSATTGFTASIALSEMVVSNHSIRRRVFNFQA